MQLIIINCAHYIQYINKLITTKYYIMIDYNYEIFTEN